MGYNCITPTTKQHGCSVGIFAGETGVKFGEMNHQKKHRVPYFPSKYWLFNRDPYFMIMT